MSRADETFAEFPKPTKPGKRLTETGEELYEDWKITVLIHDGCYCYGDMGPCKVCDNAGHPEALISCEELWESDIDFLAINKEFSSR